MRSGFQFPCWQSLDHFVGLTINKAKQRVLGSIAGLLISILIWFLIHYNYNFGYYSFTTGLWCGFCCTTRVHVFYYACYRDVVR